MGVSTSSPDKGVALVTVDFPPVNALPVQGWYDLADALRAAGRDHGTRCVVLAAEGRGFNAGVDIKEMQRDTGHAALIGANRGCYEAFAAVYECEVPVVAEVHGFCLGGGIGLVGNADAIVASEDATFGLPELDRGALGAATHLARLVPQHLMRALYYTSRTATAAELHAHGSVWQVVPRAAAGRGPRTGRRDRTEGRLPDPAGQGGHQRHRPRRRPAQLPLRAGVHVRSQPERGRRPGPQHLRRARREGALMTDKSMTPDEVVGQLRSGMTLGIGGWGSRRKPMALVRALLRSEITDLTVVSYGGPDVGLLAAAGRIRRLVAPFATLDSIPLEPHFRAARESCAFTLTEYDEAMFMWGLHAAANRLPFLPVRAGLGSDVMRVNPELRTITSPYADGEEFVAVPALRLDAALVHLNRADRLGNAQYLGPDPYFDDLFCEAADAAYVSCEQLVETSELSKAGPPQSLLVSRHSVTGVVETPNGAHFTSCVPDYGRDEAFQKLYAATPWPEFRARFLSGGSEHAYQSAVQAWHEEQQ